MIGLKLCMKINMSRIGKRAQKFTVQTALSVAHNSLQLQLQKTQHLLLSSIGTYTHMHKPYMHKNLTKIIYLKKNMSVSNWVYHQNLYKFLILNRNCFYYGNIGLTKTDQSTHLTVKQPFVSQLNSWSQGYKKVVAKWPSKCIDTGFSLSA